MDATNDMAGNIRVATAHLNKIFIWTNTSGLPERVLETGSLNYKVLFYDFNFLFSGNIESVQLWDLSSESNTTPYLEIQTAGVSSLELWGDRLFVGLQTGDVEAYDINFQEASYAKAVTYSAPFSRQGNDDDRATAILRLDHLYVGYQNGDIAVFNHEDSSYLQKLDAPEYGWYVTSIVASYQKIVASYRYGFIKEWDLNTLQRLETTFAYASGWVNGLAVGSSNRLYAAIDNDIHVFDWVSGVRLAKLSAHTDWITAFVVRHFWEESLNVYVVSASDDMSLSVWVDFDVYGWEKSSEETTEENDFGDYGYTIGENDFGGYEYTTPEE